MNRKFRITRSIDYKRVRRFGKSYAHPLVVLVLMNGDCDYSRAGFITGKYIGNAVKRNRVKRQLKAVLSSHIPFFISNSDVLIIAREPIRNASFDEIKTAIYQLLIKANLINSNDRDTRRSAS